MAPKTKVCKKMIIDAAFELIRKDGIENVNARTVSKELNCSTQPVMYHFKTIDELKRELYEKADIYHSNYIMNIHSDEPIKDIGLNYIQFAVKEKNLFRFLFQSNGFIGKNILEIMNAEELYPIINMISQKKKISLEKAKTIFRLAFLVIHGYASMFANNEMEYDEEAIFSDMCEILNENRC